MPFRIPPFPAKLCKSTSWNGLWEEQDDLSYLLPNIALHCSNSGGASHSMTPVPAHCSLLAWRCRNGLVQTPGGEWMAAEPGAPNKCPGVFTMEALEAHERECPFTLMVCGFPGCNEEVMRSELEAHEEAATARHMQLLLKDLQETKAELQETKAEQRATKAELRDSKRKLEPLEREVASLKATRMTQGAHEGSLSLLGSGRIVSGTRDKTLKVFRLADGSCEKTLQGHGYAVSCVAVLPGGERVVSGSEDKTLKVWRLADGSCEKTLQGHRYWVRCVAVLPGGERVVSGSFDMTLKVFRLADGSCEKTLQGHRHVVNCVAVLPGGERVVSGSRDKTLKVWRLADGSCEKTLQGQSEVWCVAAL